MDKNPNIIVKKRAVVKEHFSAGIRACNNGKPMTGFRGRVLANQGPLVDDVAVEDLEVECGGVEVASGVQDGVGVCFYCLA